MARSILPLLLAIAVAFTFFLFLRQNLDLGRQHEAAYIPQGVTITPEIERPLSTSVTTDSQSYRSDQRPVKSDGRHPIDTLVKEHEHGFKTMLDRQSMSLEEAVSNYKKRYGMSPPPGFDVWYKFAKQKGIQIIDEYDTIHHSLLPFWALKPSTVRARVREALGYDENSLMAIMIRDGKFSLPTAGSDWQLEAIVEMIGGFVKFLPDMDLAFNVFDEPRVVMPHDELDRLVTLGKMRQAASSTKSKRNHFSSHPGDISSGLRVTEEKTTRFNNFSHQATWLPSRLSCSIDSAARAIEDVSAQDDSSQYSFSPLGFVANWTAFTDICNTPSLRSSHGFFDSPNAFSVVHDLFPIFSQSKMSSFQDILYPSPWYWSQKVEYDPEVDPDWNNKTSKLWWVGSTTGGFSHDGGWRRHHRQGIVTKLNAMDKASVMDRTNPDASAWSVQEVERVEHKDLVDVHFSHIGQCTQRDCAAQAEFFNITTPTKFSTAWKQRFLLDMDGNAFSGRFYAFLESKSLPVKMSLFREWHEEWIRPWVHYVPLSLKADEGLEIVRYFTKEAEGRQIAQRLAGQGREWAHKALRKAHAEAWLFRLLLEYARVIDDDRESIGYD